MFHRLTKRTYVNADETKVVPATSPEAHHLLGEAGHFIEGEKARTLGLIQDVAVWPHDLEPDRDPDMISVAPSVSATGQVPVHPEGGEQPPLTAGPEDPDQGEPGTGEEPAALEDMTVKELQELAQQRELTNYSQLNKAGLIALIKESKDATTKEAKGPETKDA